MLGADVAVNQLECKTIQREKKKYWNKYKCTNNKSVYMSQVNASLLFIKCRHTYQSSCVVPCFVKSIINFFFEEENKTIKKNNSICIRVLVQTVKHFLWIIFCLHVHVFHWSLLKFYGCDYRLARLAVLSKQVNLRQYIVFLRNIGT